MCINEVLYGKASVFDNMGVEIIIKGREAVVELVVYTVQLVIL